MRVFLIWFRDFERKYFRMLIRNSVNFKRIGWFWDSVLKYIILTVGTPYQLINKAHYPSVRPSLTGIFETSSEPS